jgi:hypothetical protein
MKLIAAALALNAAQSTVIALTRNTDASPVQPAINPSAGLPNLSATSRARGVCFTPERRHLAGRI